MYSYKHTLELKMNEIKSVCYKYIGVILTKALTWEKWKILVSLKVAEQRVVSAHQGIYWGCIWQK